MSPSTLRSQLFPSRSLASLLTERDPVDPETLIAANSIVQRVRTEGAPAVRELAVRFGDRASGEPLVLERPTLDAALASLSSTDRGVLERTAGRIEDFARSQRSALVDIDVAVPGGRAGHHVRPVARAGCYAPGGRFPLPSTVLMTAVTARVAGVAEVVVASPRPGPVTLAAAAIAGADRVLAVGGAQAIAALAYGIDGLPAVDVVVGPGNRWVTAAKQLVVGRVRIDMLAGPSELVVLADDTAEAPVIAADLLAQAEHDPDAVPILITPSATLAQQVSIALEAQLAVLPTADTARAALANGGALLVDDLDAAVAAADALAPEHLQVLTADARGVAARCTRYGGLFVGSGTAEVFGDYGLGPNHTLPTGGTARFSGGLSVLSFLAVRTWMEVDPPSEVLDDVERLARMEGLEGHARAAGRRRR